MAFFGVTREKIGDIRSHPNADRLELATLDGVSFQFVVAKDSYKIGDEVLYFPIDSVLPDDLIEKLGLTGKLSGKKKNRIKTVRLRGEISQGIVGPVSLLNDPNETNPEKITKSLGVTKYEPPVVPCKSANLVRLPVGLSKYDIEGVERNMDIVEKYFLSDPSIPVCITEKIEGMNISITWSSQDKRIYINQRNHSIEPIEGHEHVAWKTFREQEYIDMFETILDAYGRQHDITLYGELIGPGIQKNIYQLNNHDVVFFDLKIDKFWVDAWEFHRLLGKNSVPLLSRTGFTLSDWLNGKTIVDASSGPSVLNPGILREGIVIKPEDEIYDEKFGRVVVKQRDPVYLAESKI